MWKYLRGESDEDVVRHVKKAGDLLQKIDELKQDTDRVKNYPELAADESRLKHIKSRSKAYVFGPEKRNNELEVIENKVEILQQGKQQAKQKPKQRTPGTVLDHLKKLEADDNEKKRLNDELFELLQSDFGATTEQYPNLKDELKQFVADHLHSPAMIQSYIDFLKQNGKTTDEHFLVGSDKFKLPKPPVKRKRTCYNLSEQQTNYIKKNWSLDPLTEGGTRKRKHAARRAAHGRSRRAPTPRRARSRRSAALRHRASRRAKVR